MQAHSANGTLPFVLSPERAFRRYLSKRLTLFKAGSLQLELPNGTHIQHTGQDPGPNATIKIKRWRLLRKLLLEGEIGLARGFVDGDWSTPDLAAVLELGLRNETSITAATRGMGIAHLLNRFAHRRNANTRSGSRRNIAAHYDLGNAFYRLWLDDKMMYSSAIYESAGDTLEQAQDYKLDRAIELMDLVDDASVLEIGCGWGSLSRRVAEAGAAHVRGISLSQEQIAYANKSIADTNVASIVSFDLCDYRSINERYDRIISIEMFEAVGEQYWPVFFEHLRRNLTDDGKAVMQIITISEEFFESYRSRPDFIQQYIFPGGMLPTVSIVKGEAQRAGFEIEHYEHFGSSYADTLDVWHERFNKAWPQIEQLGFDNRFRRMWNYYLNYCAVGFRHGWVDVGLFKLSPTKT